MLALVEADDRLDRAVHRAQMHRHVRRVGDEAALGVEHRAGEIEPLLDVDGIGGVLQRHAHLLGDRHEEIVEDLQHAPDRPWRRSPRAAPAASTRRSTTWFFARDLGAPAVLDDDRLMRLDDQRRARRPARRARDARAGRRSPRARRRWRRTALRARRTGAARSLDRLRALGKARRAADRLDVDRLDHERLGADR